MNFDQKDVSAFMTLAEFAACNGLGPCVDGSQVFRDSGAHRIYTAQFEIIRGHTVDEFKLLSNLYSSIVGYIQPYKIEVYDGYVYIEVFT